MDIHINITKQLDEMGYTVFFDLAYYKSKDRDFDYILRCYHNDNFSNDTEYQILKFKHIDNYSHIEKVLLDADSDNQNDFENVDEVFEYFVKLISENENIKKEDILRDCSNSVDQFKENNIYEV